MCVCMCLSFPGLRMRVPYKVKDKRIQGQASETASPPPSSLSLLSLTLSQTLSLLSHFLAGKKEKAPACFNSPSRESESVVSLGLFSSVLHYFCVRCYFSRSLWLS